jgi:hypothetical protein
MLQAGVVSPIAWASQGDATSNGSFRDEMKNTGERFSPVLRVSAYEAAYYFKA